MLSWALLSGIPQIVTLVIVVAICRPAAVDWIYKLVSNGTENPWVDLVNEAASSSLVRGGKREDIEQLEKRILGKSRHVPMPFSGLSGTVLTVQ